MVDGFFKWHSSDFDSILLVVHYGLGVNHADNEKDIQRDKQTDRNMDERKDGLAKSKTDKERVARVSIKVRYNYSLMKLEALRCI